MIISKEIKNNIIPVWQGIGYSTHALTKSIGAIIGKVTTHTGTLDPLASGVVVILAGDQRFNKINMAGFPKTYEFKIAFGIKTDSYDGMGKILCFKPLQPISEEQIREVVANFKGPYVQEVPLYSAIKLNGKRLFDYPKIGVPVEALPKKRGEIHEISVDGVELKELKKVCEEVLANIGQVKHGKFRQVELLAEWESFLSQNKPLEKTKLQVVKIRTTISRGMYIRSLSQDISQKLGAVGFTLSLTRVQNGPYLKENCVFPSDFGL